MNDSFYSKISEMINASSYENFVFIIDLLDEFEDSVEGPCLIGGVKNNGNTSAKRKMTKK